MSREIFVVLVNAPPDKAPEIARALVERRVAACVNIVPGVRSFYRWEGNVQDEAESTMLIKTAADRVDALTAAVKELHPYDVPEIIALPVDPKRGEGAYLDWVVAETRVAADPG